MRKNSILIIILGTIAGILLFGSTGFGFCHSFGRGMFTGQMMWPFMSGGMFVWVLLLIGFAYLFWVYFKPDKSEPHSYDPLEVARLRLARGEISREEYDLIISKLKNDSK
jgi:uncharacterized membrane protein